MRDETSVAERLPDEIVERMRRAGDAAAVGTMPWPGVERAVRRERRRTAAGGVAALAAVTLAGGGLVAAMGPGTSSSSPALTPTPSVSESVPGPDPTPTPPGPYQNRRRPGAPVPEAPVGIGATAGSLAGDGAWLAAVRETLARSGQADGPEQVHVLWAGEHDGGRYVVAVAPEFDRENGTGSMSWILMSWQLSDDGRKIVRGGSGVLLEPRQDVRTVSMALELDPGFSSLADGAITLVVDARARSVDLGEPARYPANGQKERTFTPLRREGIVWVGAQTGEQLVRGLLRITGADGVRRLGSRSIFSSPAPTGPSFDDVAPAGADPALLRCAGSVWADFLPAGSEPVFGGTARAFDGGWGVGAFRAPDGGYLMSSCADGGAPVGSRWVMPAPAGGPDRLTALLPLDPFPESARTFIAVAPADATRVELAGRSVPVRDRLAVIHLDTGRAFEGLRLTARRADGSVAGTAGVAPTDTALDRRFVDEGLCPC